MGMIDFSPELNRLGKIWEMWRIVVRKEKAEDMHLKKGQKVNRGRIKKLARACGVSRPLSVNIATA
eukprot:2844905-Ditylum_brightwellii.AAC.1